MLAESDDGGLQMTAKRYRVAQWGMGFSGKVALQALIEYPDFGCRSSARCTCTARGRGATNWSASCQPPGQEPDQVCVRAVYVIGDELLIVLRLAQRVPGAAHDEGGRRQHYRRLHLTQWADTYRRTSGGLRRPMPRATYSTSTCATGSRQFASLILTTLGTDLDPGRLQDFQHRRASQPQCDRHLPAGHPVHVVLHHVRPQ
jgi:hypothetical protein